MARKKWRLVCPDSAEINQFGSQLAAYEFVDALRDAWAAGAPGSGGRVTVQVDEGNDLGWQPYEHLDFAEEGLR